MTYMEICDIIYAALAEESQSLYAIAEKSGIKYKRITNAFNHGLRQETGWKFSRIADTYPREFKVDVKGSLPVSKVSTNSYDYDKLIMWEEGDLEFIRKNFT